MDIADPNPRTTRARPARPGLSPKLVSELRARVTKGEDVVDPTTWAGSIPAAFGIAPRVRVGENRWFNVLWLLPIGWGLLLVGVATSQYLRTLPEIEQFVVRHGGTGSAFRFATPLPGWVRVQHFLNLFFLTFIVRAGLQILADHPRLYWTRHSTPGKEWLRAQKEVPDVPLWTAKQDSITLPRHLGLPGIRHSIGLARWWHLGVDTLWLANGVVFYVLLFATGEWRRIVPTSSQVLPDAASVLIQYLSLDWPTNDGWVAYNGLQLLAYFVTVFVAAPAALITGLGMSPALSTRFHGISKRLSIQVARSLHFLVLCWFLVFVVVHVTLVFATGALRNLNHVYVGVDATRWTGLGVFALSMAVVVVAWVAATPFTLKHPRWVQRIGFALIGPAQRLFEHVDAKPGSYTEEDVSPYFWHNGRYPETPEYRVLFERGFADWRLRVRGLVDHPVELSLDELRAMPRHEQITQHFCIQGWSGIAKWGGVSMQTILDLVRPTPEAKWVVFYSLGEGADGGLYYDAHPIEQMRYHLTMLAYDMNGEPLSYGHGAPLRLRNEVQLGFKQVKWIAGIDFVADIADVGGGYGGYNEDHEFFGYRQSIRSRRRRARPCARANAREREVGAHARDVVDLMRFAQASWHSPWNCSLPTHGASPSSATRTLGGEPLCHRRPAVKPSSSACCRKRRRSTAGVSDSRPSPFVRNVTRAGGLAATAASSFAERASMSRARPSLLCLQARRMDVPQRPTKRSSQDLAQTRHALEEWRNRKPALSRAEIAVVRNRSVRHNLCIHV